MKKISANDKNHMNLALQENLWFYMSAKGKIDTDWELLAFFSSVPHALNPYNVKVLSKYP